MLIKTMNGWALPKRAVRYARDGEEFEQVMGDESEQWWLDFAEKWGGMDNVEFVDLQYTSEQLARLEEIQDISGRYAEQCEAYVMDGTVPDIPPFAWKQGAAENEQQGVEISEREIENITQGQQISELEIQVLELMPRV